MTIETITGPEAIATGYGDYLTDESRLAGGGVEALYFPTTTEETAILLDRLYDEGTPVCVSGGRTGIVGGAVPVEAKALVSLERLTLPIRVGYDHEHDEWFARVGAGTRLSELNAALRKRAFELTDPALYERMGERVFFYPVDPTETTATIGGTVATNASGARTFAYGPTRAWVRAATVVLPNGNTATITHDKPQASRGRIVLRTHQGQEFAIPVRDIRMPFTKNTAGYHLKGSMSLLDLIVGSEGTLAVVTEVEVRILPLDPNRLYLLLYLGDGADTPALVDCLRNHERIRPLAIEYFDARSLDLLRDWRRRFGSSSHVPAIPEAAREAIYVEAPFEDEAGLDAIAADLRGIEAVHGVVHDWAEFTPKGLEAMKRFRHQLPEAVNTIVGQRKHEAPSLHKVGTDMAVPDRHLRTIMTFYRKTLDASGLEYVIFGHIGDNHLHVNILPRNEDELRQAKSLYETFARKVVSLKGSVSAEHGIGRMKRAFVPLQYDDERLEAMRAVRRAFDPKGLLNPGVLFESVSSG